MYVFIFIDIYLNHCNSALNCKVGIKATIIVIIERYNMVGCGIMFYGMV